MRYDDKTAPILLSKYSLVRTVILTLTLAFVLATAAAAQDWSGRGRAQGRVTDKETGNPLVGVQVTLLREGVEGQGPPPLMTDKKGHWSYLGLRNGNWTILLDFAEYQPSQGGVHVSEFSAGKAVNVDMKRIPRNLEQEAAEGRMSRLEEGNVLLAAGKFAEARRAYEEVLAEITDLASQVELRQIIAQAAYQEGDFSAARSGYEELLGLVEEPAKHPPLLVNIARTYYEQDDVTQAITILEKALALAPDDIVTLKLTISLMVAANREADAQAYMARLPEGEKVDPDALLNMGITLFNGNDFEGALEKFNRAMAENPNLVDVYYYRGMVYLNQGKNAEAVADFEKLLELSPDHANAGEAKQFAEYLKTKL
jgi:tetratricopeptide (TPR) repeat protein